MPIQSRNFGIDFLRFIGMVGIMLSHSVCPTLLMNIRNFDVPLMVFISSYCLAEYSYKNTYMEYVRGRFLRIYTPPLIFVVCYYLFASAYFPFGSLLDLNPVINAMLLLTPDALWILRVFLSIAIISPAFLFLFHKYSKSVNIAILVAMFVVNEFLASVAGDYKGEGYVACIIVMTLGYSIVAYVGIILSRLHGKQIFTFGCLFFIIFALISTIYYYYYGYFLDLSERKYPPSLYYVSYGLGVSLILFSIRDSISKVVSGEWIKRVISFIGSHTMWIYLWHIPFFSLSFGLFTWYIRFFIILLAPMVVVLIQSYIVNFLSCRNGLGFLKKVLIG